MKQLSIFVFSFLFLLGCIGKDSDTAKMTLNVDSINFCERPANETVVWSDVQVLSAGKEALTISDVAVRGDDACAFHVSYPKERPNGTFDILTAREASKSGDFAPFQLSPSGAMLIRIAYTPSSVGVTDRADLVITSNAANLEDGDAKTVTTVIPMCGTGVDALQRTPAAADGGGDDGGGDGGGDAMDGGDATCIPCGKPLKKDAAGCEAGYDSL